MSTTNTRALARSRDSKPFADAVPNSAVACCALFALLASIERVAALIPTTAGLDALEPLRLRETGGIAGATWTVSAIL